MFFLCGSMEYMFWGATEPRNMDMPWSNTTAPCSPTARLEKAAASFTAQPLHVSVCFVTFMGGAEGPEHELAYSGGAHACQAGADCTNLVPMLLTWHSTLYNRHTPTHTKSTCQYTLLGGGGGWQGKGLHIRHVPQLPLEVTFSARHLPCRFILKHWASL
jgi:hypothetical protein